MTSPMTARHVTDWAGMAPDGAGAVYRERFEAGAAGLAGLETPLDFASLYVTARCHLNCVHCHAEEEFQGTGPTGDVPTGTLLDVIFQLAQVTRRVQLTGGEIFVRRDPGTGRNDVPLLVRAISALGREPILQTTGTGLTPQSTAFYAAHGVRWAALSLDGPTPALNALIRGRESAFAPALRAVGFCTAAGIAVKVGTVVTRITLDRDRFFELGDLLERRGVAVWKLMHFYAREAGRASAANEGLLSVTTAEFEGLVAAVRARYAGSGMGIADHGLETFGAAPALLVQPTGAVTVTEGTRDVPMGNVLAMDRAQMLAAFASVAPTVNVNLRNTYREER